MYFINLVKVTGYGVIFKTFSAHTHYPYNTLLLDLIVLYIFT